MLPNLCFLELFNALVAFLFWLIKVHSCETTQRIHCHSVLTALQSHVYFKQCYCDGLDSSAADQCNHLYNTIFLHACVRKEGKTTYFDTTVKIHVLFQFL